MASPQLHPSKLAADFSNDFVPLWNKLSDFPPISEGPQLRTAVQQLTIKVRDDLSANNALTPERDAMLIGIPEDLSESEAAANAGQYIQMNTALQRALGRINNVMVDLLA